MRWTGNEMIDLMTGENVERMMFVELFGPLIQLEAEWRRSGVSEEEINMTAFDFDYVDRHIIGNTAILGGLKPIVIEETTEYLITRDELGRRMKLIKASASIPLPLDYPVKTMDDWLRIKPLYTYNEARITEKEIRKAKSLQENGTLIIGDIPGGFDLPRQLMGEEELCYAFYDQPELIHDILNTAGETALKVFDQITDMMTIDLIQVHEDMAGKSGPLMGPGLFKEFVTPYYRSIWDVLSNKGTRVFSQDSDGNMEVLMDACMEAGINQMYPFEPAAGMDMVKLREKYDQKLMIKGGIDKHALRIDRNAILRELEYKMQPSMQQGGVIFGLDHRIPNGVTIENYRFYVDTAREILGIPKRNEGSKGWKRMAF